MFCLSVCMSFQRMTYFYGDKLKSLYLRQWSRSPEYLYYGHNGHAQYRRARHPPPDQVGPPRINIRLIGDRLIHDEPKHHDALKKKQRKNSKISCQEEFLLNANVKFKSKLDGFYTYQDKDWANKLPANSPINSRCEPQHVFDVLWKSVSSWNVYLALNSIVSRSIHFNNYLTLCCCYFTRKSSGRSKISRRERPIPDGCEKLYFSNSLPPITLENKNNIPPE